MRPAAAAAGRKLFLKVPMSIRGVRMAVGKQEARNDNDNGYYATPMGEQSFCVGPGGPC